jgi:predicted phage terminase large subunit-like protein
LTVIQKIKPQRGPQEKALSSSADIVIMGGAAGVGKTFAILMEPLRHVDNPGFGAVIFRRESPQITNQGGLWDESEKIYPKLANRPEPNKNQLSWEFPSGARVRFSHMQYAKDRFAWDGSQIPMIGFDQLESFEEIQFWYMLSRNRTACGIRPYVRATCNPVPDDHPIGGWLNKLISWWIDPETGYAIPERSGVIRWLVRISEKLYWGDTREELTATCKAAFPELPDEDIQPKSLTFIPGLLSDNKILMDLDPGYRANLLAQPLIERERLLAGNWKIKPTAGKVFNRAWFKIFHREIPSDVRSWVRYWDKAGTEGGGKYSAGVLMGRRPNGNVVVAGVTRGQWSALNRETVLKQTATSDRARFGSVAIWVEQEPGSGGKESAENTVRNLAGHTIRSERVTGDKVSRAGPLSAQAEAGNVELVIGPWNEDFLSEAQNFDGVHGFCDQIDAASGAYNKIQRRRVDASDVAVPVLGQESGWAEAGYPVEERESQ